MLLWEQAKPHDLRQDSQNWERLSFVLIIYII